MEKQLEQLRAEASDLEEKLNKNRKKQSELAIAIYTRDNKLAVGDKVIIGGKQKGIIDSFETKYNRLGVMPLVQLYKKDGTLGKRFQSVWRHHKVEKISE
jgi:hypothetical protein